MRKKLDTRFPAARIKKIMQADEDVGKIALAVPVLVSKALELFLQDLCDQTYEITLHRGAKTVSSLHLKNCVERYNVFDFLREVVSKVPDYGHGHGHSQGHVDVAMDDRSISKRRKPPGDELNDSDEDLKKTKVHEMGHAGTSGRGSGRGRGRGRGRSAKTSERELLHHREMEIDASILVAPPQHTQEEIKMHAPLQQHDTEKKDVDERSYQTKEEPQCPKEGNNDTNSGLGRGFDLNTQSLDVEMKPQVITASREMKIEEYPCWSIPNMGNIDPVQLANMSKRLDEDEEDYDEEES
ncbi:PREDICTED: dr1-associated corepressor homolog [Camelina sativa]|uniref:Dr1-associated corepressor homolog n=1 Tax=Camelina sativa TaxID=90675 RepID=A0ABM0XUR5_CAMSA|nr:PREDICTED: dr1-associated corepressor homolog [Camelina sativa]